MEVIPAIDIRDGACVQLVGGDVAQEKIHIDDPVAQARAFIQHGARWIHIVDLDRALGTGNNLQLIKRILELPGAKFQVGGGVRFTEDIDDILIAGAARVVVGTRAVTDDKWFAHVAERYNERVYAAVDVRGDDILIKGWQQSSGKKLPAWTKQADALGLGGFIYTDVDKEGRMGGANVEKVAQLCAQVKAPVIASGGIRNEDDLQMLADAGAWGAIVGMAAYTGGIDLHKAVERFR